MDWSFDPVTVLMKRGTVGHSIVHCHSTSCTVVNVRGFTIICYYHRVTIPRSHKSTNHRVSILQTRDTQEYERYAPSVSHRGVLWLDVLAVRGLGLTLQTLGGSSIFVQYIVQYSTHIELVGETRLLTLIMIFPIQAPSPMEMIFLLEKP